ncbi:MAG: hypothetical protein RJB60_2754, partial [Pseudomonadota bacterium]
MNVAYFINQYPKVSHSFIRREIHALESMGVQVHRFALRGWADPVVDAEDIQEQGKTLYVLQGGVKGLLWPLLVCLLQQPLAWWAALKLA